MSMMPGNASGPRRVLSVNQSGQRMRLGDVFFDSFFQYGVNIAFDGTGLNTVNASIPIQSDAHFMWVHAVYDVGTAAGVVPALLSGGALLVITDGATQRQLSNIAIPASTLFGTAQQPYPLPFTHVFKANTNILIQATGSAAAMASITMRLVFAGFKIPVRTGSGLDS